jgi:hypothetical protein
MLTGALGYVCSTSTRDGAQKSQTRKEPTFGDSVAKGPKTPRCGNSGTRGLRSQIQIRIRKGF